MSYRATALGALALATLLVGACTDDVEACRRQSLSVGTGVYGCVTSYDDVGRDNDVLALPGFSVEIFPGGDPPAKAAAPLALTESDEIGFYEIAVAPGAYWICTAFRRCVEITVPTAGGLAMDYEYSAGPGWAAR